MPLFNVIIRTSTNCIISDVNAENFSEAVKEACSQAPFTFDSAYFETSYFLEKFGLIFDRGVVFKSEDKNEIILCCCNFNYICI